MNYEFLCNASKEALRVCQWPRAKVGPKCMDFTQLYHSAQVYLITILKIQKIDYSEGQVPDARSDLL